MRVVSFSLASLLILSTACSLSAAAPRSRAPVDPCYRSPGVLRDTLYLARVSEPADLGERLRSTRSLEYAANRDWFVDVTVPLSFQGKEYRRWGLLQNALPEPPDSLAARVVRLASVEGIPLYVRPRDLEPGYPRYFFLPTVPGCIFVAYAEVSEIR